MTAPTARVRALTYKRDGYRCVACGATDGLSWQHRTATGMGGAGVKAARMTPADGVTACLPCNQRFEADLQDLALANGWKLRKFRGDIGAHEVPFYDRNRMTYLLPTTTGEAVEVDPMRALDLLEAAGSLTRKAAS